MYNKAFGTYTYTTGNKEAVPVTPASVYDVASLTKTTATLLAVMKLYDKGRLSLTDRVSDYLPYLQDTDKRNNGQGTAVPPVGIAFHLAVLSGCH